MRNIGISRRAAASVLALLGIGLLRSGPVQGSPAQDNPVQGSKPGKRPMLLAAYGDSLVHGYGLAPSDTLPERLEAALRQEGWAVTVVNAGNSGDTTASGLARLDWTLAEPPDALLLALGANDGLRGLDPAETEANLRAIVEILHRRQVPIQIAGMLAPRNLGPDYAAAFDPIYRKLARDYGLILTPFLLEGVALVPELNQADGIHPNAEGVAVMVQTLLPGTRALLRRALHRS
ncbi:MAG: arylesterase [Rhodospirillales bacterium]|nr:arylesterase [Rhodospirillales bacterium]